jgi:hypothetical protein
MKFFSYQRGEMTRVLRIGPIQIMIAWQGEDLEKCEGSWREVSFSWS